MQSGRRRRYRTNLRLRARLSNLHWRVWAQSNYLVMRRRQIYAGIRHQKGYTILERLQATSTERERLRMDKLTTDFKEYLYERLQDPEAAAEYLNAAGEGDDAASFLIALRLV